MPSAVITICEPFGSAFRYKSRIGPRVRPRKPVSANVHNNPQPLFWVFVHGEQQAEVDEQREQAEVAAG